MRTRLEHFWERLRANYWFVPTLMAAVACLLAWGTLWVDDHPTARPRAVGGWIWGGGADGARALLEAVAASSITVAGTVFSITIVALTLASGQFGPRLLRNFMRDLGNQVVLGTFIATYAYCLLVLRRVRAVDESQFVPHVSVTVGLALAMASVGVLIYYIHHVSVSIHADYVIAAVWRDLTPEIEGLYAEGAADVPDGPAAEGGRGPGPGAGTAVTSAAAGYVRVIDYEELVGAASAADVTIRMAVRPGQFVVSGGPLAWVGPCDLVGGEGRGAPAPLDEALRATVVDAVIVGRTRTPTQDVEYAINQLVEIAVRALSPGVNDPFTAVTCVDWLADVLCKLAGRSLPSGAKADATGRVRVVARPTTFGGVADAAFNQIRQYGASSPAVLIRLTDALGAIGRSAATDAHRQVVARHLAMIERAAAALPEEDDRRDLCERVEEAGRALGVRKG
jgi:uncharacterized membrane protein